MRKRPELRHGAVAWALVLLCASALAQAPESTSEDSPVETDLREEVTVQLREVRLRITDKLGAPVTGVKAEELVVRQGGVRQKVAYLEPVTERALEGTTPMPLYDSAGQPIAAEDVVVEPPQQQRRIVIAFDPRNSRTRVREDWRAAAIAWVERHMKSEDRAGVVVLRPYTDWVLRSSDRPDRVIHALQTADLFTDLPDRNRRDEMAGFLNEMRQLCVDTTESKVSGSATRYQSNRGTDLDSEALSCAYSLAQPLVREWSFDSESSYEGIRSLTGELAAIPGEKVIVLFSEGMIDDAATVTVHAMTSVFGFEVVDQTSMISRLRRQELRGLGELYRRAAAADVVVSTIDTRHASDGSQFFDLENTVAPTTQRLGLDPYREMYESTRSTLAGLAYATGGKPFYGPDELANKVRSAADAFFGVYVLGYYLAEGTDPGDKLRVRLDRPRVKLDYDKRPGRPYRPALLGMDLAIGRPRLHADGHAQTLPVAVLVGGETLPFRRQGPYWGCELGLFVQAVRPDGTVVDETFEQVSLVLEKEEYEGSAGRRLRHVAELALPAGPVRIRARLSDDRQEKIADRSIDVTLVPGGGVEAGLKQSTPPERSADATPPS